MANYLKWGLIGVLIVGVVVFKDQIKGALVSAGSSLGQAVGGSATGFIQGAVQGLSGGVFGQPAKEGGSVLADIFFKGVPQAGGEEWHQTSTGQTYPAHWDDPIVGRDNAGDSTITPQNRDYSDAVVQKFERSKNPSAQNVARFIRSGTTPEQFKQGLNAFTNAYVQSRSEQPTLGHAERVRQALYLSQGVTPLEYFRSLQAQGLNITQAGMQTRALFNR